jgi:hypothetical protein
MDGGRVRTFQEIGKDGILVFWRESTYSAYSVWVPSGRDGVEKVEPDAEKVEKVVPLKRCIRYEPANEPEMVNVATSDDM